jgi:cation transport regulator ChaC
MLWQLARAHPVEEDTVWGVAYRIAEDKEREVWDYLGERPKTKVVMEHGLMSE